MDEQLTLRLPAEMAQELGKAAKRLQRSRSEIVRLALAQYLGTKSEGRPIDKVRDLLGSINSGVPDLGQRHREYLIERLRNAR